MLESPYALRATPGNGNWLAQVRDRAACVSAGQYSRLLQLRALRDHKLDLVLGQVRILARMRRTMAAMRARRRAGGQRAA